MKDAYIDSLEAENAILRRKQKEVVYTVSLLKELVDDIMSFESKESNKKQASMLKGKRIAYQNVVTRLESILKN